MRLLLTASPQFLDEADLLADTIAVLAAPGKLVAHGTPVSLKSSLGEGYTVNVSFNVHPQEKSSSAHQGELLGRIRTLAPLAYPTSSAPNEVSYHLKIKGPPEVQKVLELVEGSRETYGVASYSVMGTSIEDIFLGLMHDDTPSEDKELEKTGSSATPSLDHTSRSTTPLQLTNGRRRSPLSQALTIFHKRILIAKRSWLTPCLAVLVAVAGSCIPIFFLSGRATQTCVTRFRTVPQTPLYLPASPLGFIAEVALGSRVLESPPGIISTLSNTSLLLTQNITDNATFVNTIDQTFLNQSFGGVSINTQTGASLFAWEATPPGLTGLVMLNLVSNTLYNNALNETGRAAAAAPSVILANYQTFPGIAAGTLVALKWVAFFGAAMVRGLALAQWECTHFAMRRRCILRSSRFTSRKSAARLSRRCSCPMACRTRLAYGSDTCYLTPSSLLSSRPSSSSSSRQRPTSSMDLASSYVVWSNIVAV